MSHRLATVFWWFGALTGLCIVAGAVIALQSNPPWINAAVAGAGLALVTAPCWAIAFVLGGSFWRPPRKAKDIRRERRITKTLLVLALFAFIGVLLGWRG